MSGSEIDIVQGKAEEAVRSYRTTDAAKKLSDRIVQGLLCKDYQEKKRSSPTCLRK